MEGLLKEILISAAAGERMESIAEAELVSGSGIVGDRYYCGKGTFSERLAGMPDVQVTLIQKEEIDAFNAKSGLNLSAEDFRRNLVTAGLELNDLVGKEFTVGPVTLRGLRLCEPCSHLAAILGNEIMNYMVHKAGLRAQVVSGGRVKVNQSVKLCSTK